MNSNYRVNGNASTMVDSTRMQFERPTYRQLKRILLDTIHSGWYMRVKHKDILVGDTYIAYSWSDGVMKTTVVVNVVHKALNLTVLPLSEMFVVATLTTMTRL